MENTTPMLRQYLEIKKEHPGTILFFRLGDFYEMFNEDAITGSRELEITLTARQKDSPNPIPMCGVPHHAAAGYIARLVRKGYRVAICEQAEPAAKGVKLVKREVVRVITPGTAVDEQLNGAKSPHYLAAIALSASGCGGSVLDLSTGEFLGMETEGPNAAQRLAEQLAAFEPKEILFSSDTEADVRSAFGLKNARSLSPATPDDDDATAGFLLTPLDGSEFHGERALSVLSTHFKTKDLKGFGFDGREHAVRAAGACLAYVQKTQRSAVEHITGITYFDSADHMVLDAVTMRNLEILDSRNDNNKHTLLKVIDETVTSMGARLLRAWLLRPSIKRREIQTRQIAVEELSDAILRDSIRHLLKTVGDLERVISKLNLGTASPRDLLALKQSISNAPEIRGSIADSGSLLLQVLAENISEFSALADMIGKAIADEPSVSAAAGGVIRDGFDARLDEARALSRSGKQTIAAFEENERKRSGIATLKVRFNQVFGYYIEVSKAQLARVPAEYERKQTLANAERFTTPELKDWEQKVLNAEEESLRLEAELFSKVVEDAKAETSRLQSTARALATVDVLAALAELAARRNYVCPTLHDGDEIEIKNGRHPVVEAFLGTSFIPNDLYLNNSTDRLLIVTGANMGGKSTILRQAALIQVLAQIGSFVPATSARLPMIDRVWTRVGASDDLASGRSTFMVEMTETAAILHNATPKSLILLDEIGRGTSTFDGLSIAWAVAEYLHNSPEHSAKTMFATHYHELTELAEHLPGAQNYQISATETDGEVVFLHKLVKGKASKSYGISVARLAGLPSPVISRAEEVLAKLEKYELAVFAGEDRKGLAMAAARDAAGQFSLFAISNESAIDELRSAAVDSLSAEEGLELLKNIRARIV